MTFFKKKRNQPPIVGICGRSCAGKGALTEALASTNREILLLQADFYFHSNTSCTYKGYQCWEHTDCIALDRLIDNLDSLKKGKDTVIRIETPWMPQCNIEIFHEDMRTKKLIIVDGFLIFAVKELVDLFDYKIFVQASDVNVLYRRQMRDGVGQVNYIFNVVIPVSKEYEQIQKNNADLIIDGDRPKEKVINDVGKYLCGKLSQENPNFKIGLPPMQLPWKVYSGDLIMDNTWHPIDFDNYKEWVKKEKYRLDKGEELKGNTFRYRRNPHSGEYEVRLSTQYKPNIYRYTLKPTQPWQS
jgi:uridine kinase